MKVKESQECYFYIKHYRHSNKGIISQVCRINLKTLNINVCYLQVYSVEDKVMCCGKYNGEERKYCPFRMNKQLLILSSINMKW